MEGKNCGETLKEWRRRIGGEVNRDKDKEVEGVGGLKDDKEGEKLCLGLFKLGDAESLLLTPTCISGSLETFKLHL